MGRRRKTGLDCAMLHAAIPSNPKLKRIATLCGISKIEALGYLVSFYCHSAQHHPGGEVTDMSNAEIDDAISFPNAGRPQDQNSENRCTFAEALREKTVGVLVTNKRGKTYIHDWDEYNGKYWKELERDRIRKISAGKQADNHRKIKDFPPPPTPTPAPSPAPCKSSDFWGIVKAVKEGKITKAKRGDVAFRVFASNDHNGIVLDAATGNSDQIRVFSPSQLEGYEFLP